MNRTNRGKLIDMEALMKANETTIAVTGGGQSMNARGDILGSGGKIVKRLEQRLKEEPQRQEAQKVKLSDMRKYSSLVGEQPDETALTALRDKQRQEARKLAKKVELATASLATGGQPVIKDYTDQEGVEGVEDTKTKKPKRVIVDSEE